MNETRIPGGPGAGALAPQAGNGSDQAPPPAQPQRDSIGRFVPGATGNPHGRPKGSMNATTRLAKQYLAAKAHKAAEVVIDSLSSPVDWIRLTAARLLLERVLAQPEA